MPAPANPRRKLRVFSFLTIAVIAIGAGYYFSFYSQKHDYIVDRNFRRLSVISEQIESRMNGLHQIVINTAENTEYDPKRLDSLSKVVDKALTKVETFRTNKPVRQPLPLPKENFKVDSVLSETVKSIEAGRSQKSKRQGSNKVDVQQRQTSEELSKQVLELEQTSIDIKELPVPEQTQSGLDEVQGAVSNAASAIDYINFKDRIAAAIGIVPFATLEFADTVRSTRGQDSTLDESAWAGAGSRIEKVELVRNYLYLTCRNTPAVGPDLLFRVRADIHAMISQQISTVVFENIFMAETDGTVIYQLDKKRGNVRNFNAVYSAANPDEKLEFKELGQSGGLYESELAGEEQLLFARPLSLEFDLREKDGFNWVLVATVPANKLLSESLALPTNTILIFGMLIALFVLAWPLLNIVAAGTFTRLRKSNIALLGLSACVASALIALGLVDLYQMTHMRRAFDEQLQKTAEIAHDNLRKELRQAHKQLRFFADSLKPRLADLKGAWTYTPLIIETQRPIDSTRAEKLYLERLMPRASNLFNFRRGDTVNNSKNIGWHYLNFERIFYADAEGDIRAKLAVGSAATPFLNVSSRDYFRQVQRRDLLTLQYPPEQNPSDDLSAASHTISMALSQQHSWASGSYETTIAIPINPAEGSRGGWMVGMDIATPASFKDPLLPPTFNLALLDADGNVIYHTRSERSGFENFLVECDNNARLISTLAGRQSDWMTSSYWGENRRIFTLPLRETPWTVVSYYSEEALLDGMNAGLLTSTISFYMLNLILLTILILLGLSSSKVQLDWLWPSFIDYKTYQKLTLIYLGFLAFYAFSLSQDLRFDHILIAALLLPVFFVFVTYFSLKRQQNFGLRVALILLPFVGFYPLFASIQFFTNLENWSFALRLGLSIGVLTVLPGAILGLQRWWTRKKVQDRDWRRELFVSATIYHLVIFLLQTVLDSWSESGSEAIYHIVLILLTAFALYEFQSKRSYLARDQYLHELFRHRSGRVSGAPSARKFRRTYRVFLIALTLLTGILPMIAYFILANQAVFNLLLKHSQKEMAEKIIQRESDVDAMIADLTTSESEYLSRRLQHDDRGNYHPAYFETTVQPEVERGTLSGNVSLDSVNPNGILLPKLLNRLPLSSGRGLPTGRVLGTGAHDSVWQTGKIDTGDRAVLLHRRLNSAPDILISSRAGTPSISLAKLRADETAIFLSLILASIICIGILYWACYKFGEQVLLTRFTNPRSSADEKITIPAQAPLFIVCRPLSDPAAILQRLELEETGESDDPDTDINGQQQAIDLASISDANAEDRRDKIWHIKASTAAEIREAIAKDQPSPTIYLVEAFNLDPEYSAANIDFLQELNQLQAAAKVHVVVLGSVDPAIAFTDHTFTPKNTRKKVAAADDADAASAEEFIDHVVAARAFANWETTFYTEMHDSQLYRAELELLTDEAGIQGADVQTCINILAQECYMTDWLRQKGKTLLRQFCREQEGFDESALRRQILLTAEPLYQAIWNTCSRGEKVLLANLSREGILNGKNVLGVRSLLNKQLMMLVPDPRVINDSFREYVRRDDIQAEASMLAETTARSAWENLRLPLVVLLVAGGTFLMVTQHEIIDTTTAIVSAVTVLVPGVIKALNFFKQNRAGAET